MNKWTQISNDSTNLNPRPEKCSTTLTPLTLSRVLNWMPQQLVESGSNSARQHVFPKVFPTHTCVCVFVCIAKVGTNTLRMCQTWHLKESPVICVMYGIGTLGVRYTSPLPPQKPPLHPVDVCIHTQYYNSPVSWVREFSCSANYFCHFASMRPRHLNLLVASTRTCRSLYCCLSLYSRI